MKAVLYTEYGPPDVLRVKEVERPVPGDGEVLVNIHAASVNPADLHTMYGVPFLIRLLYAPARANGLLKPREGRLGMDIAGRVEAVGINAAKFRPGDEIFGACAGGFAEYACARENRLALKPANVTFEQAASVPVAALTALQGLRDKGHIRPGQKVLIQGASGGVGTFAVQIAKSFECQVTAVCSTGNVDKARSLGADHVIDYTQEDSSRKGEQYDLILAVNGYHPIMDYRRALSPRGTFIIAGGSDPKLVQAVFQAAVLGPLITRGSGKKMGFMGITRINQEDLVFVRGLIEAGRVSPVLERCCPLAQTADALRYLEQGHAKGKVIIVPGQ